MVSKARLLAGLGRDERKIDIREPLRVLATKRRILVTGASGAIGKPLLNVLRDAGVRVIPTDINITEDSPFGTQFMDITDFNSVLQVVNFHEPDLIINLAAIKLAVPSEANPWPTVKTNVIGLQNVLNMGRKVVQVSTCKASHGYCLYGQTKGIGERLALNSGNSVVRLYNVPEATPSVLSIWDAIPVTEPLPVTPCSRYVISVNEAIASILWTCVLPVGRYAVEPGQPVEMTDYATAVFPDRAQSEIPRRRGDSAAEPLHANHEWTELTPVPYLNKIVSPNDVNPDN
jgi:FlaA1/EpsC-like NDP-sugar epimerase